MQTSCPDHGHLRGTGTRVLLVAENGGSGGIGRYCLDMCAQLGDQAAVVCLYPHQGEDSFDRCWLSRHATEAGVRLIKVDMPSRTWRPAYRQLCGILAALRDPVLHVNGRRGNFLALLARATVPDLGFVTTAHGVLGAHYRLNAAYRQVDMLACRAADAVVGVSSHTYRQLVASGSSPGKTRRVPNALPPSRIKRLARLSRPRRDRAHSTGDQVVGFLGRLGPEKGIEHFGRLAMSLAAAMPAVRFRVAGEGPLRKWLSLECESLLQSGAMEMLGEVDDAAGFLAGTDVLVMPSRNEGLPYVLLEAMAAGSAVVAYGVGGIPEVVCDSGLGVLVRPQDQDGLRTSVERLLLDPGRVERIGDAAEAHVATRYSLEKCLPAMREVYSLCGVTLSSD